jgi:hypothetical protein
MTIGGAVGAYIPLLWGGSVFSFSSVIFSGLGGIGGIWLGYKLGRAY